MSQLLHTGWRDSQEDTKYPFTDRATLLDEQQRRSIPPNTFADAYLYPASGPLERVRLSEIEVSETSVVFRVGDETTAVLASSGDVPLFSAPEMLVLVDTRGRTAGVLVCRPEEIARFASWDYGVYTFAADDAEFSARCVCPIPATALEGFVVNGEVVSGDVWFVGQQGVVLTFESVSIDGDCRRPDEEYPVLRVHAVGDPLLQRRLCEDQAGGRAAYTTPPYVRGIRVRQGADLGSSSLLFTVTPDAQGYINVVPTWGVEAEGGESIFRVKTSPEGIALNTVA